MMLISAIALICVLFFLAPTEGCSRRRQNRFPGVFINRVPVPPWSTVPTPFNQVVTLRPPPPTDPPTARPSATPTAFPTATPTAFPTAEPTAPPPPPPLNFFQPTAPRGTIQEMTRPKCVKSSEFRRQNDGQVKEQWTYACSFNIYVTVDLGTIREPTPCACGVKLDNPTPSSGNPYPGTATTSVDNVRLVIYDEQTKQIKGEIPQFQFQPNANTTRALKEKVATDQDYSTIVAGFAGLATAFPNQPALLDRTQPGQQSNVPAICFQVTQTYTTSYQWPEPNIPRMTETPNLFMTDCVPLEVPNIQNFKRDTDQVLTTAYFREFLVFSRNTPGASGYISRNRYITSMYRNNLCNSDTAFASFDRHFNSEITRTSQASTGIFQWKRSYVEVFAIAGAPAQFSQVTNYLSDGFYKITWTQKYTLTGDISQFNNNTQQLAPGLFRSALLGESPASCNGQCGKQTKLCTQLPNSWNNPTTENRADNDNTQGLYLFKVPSDSQDFNCQPFFTRCNDEITWIAFQNFGAASRDFSKLRGSHLFTGPRGAFCGVVVTPLLDTLEFKPLEVGKMIRKRGDAENSELLHVSKRSALQSGVNGLKPLENNKALAQPIADPVLEAIPNPSELGLQPATGSADQFGIPLGDHPLQLFDEAYSAPISVKIEDQSCGNFAGGAKGVEDYCVASQISAKPPCLPGQKGCSCRATASASRCDLGLSCSESNFCMVSSCPPGTAGCPCSAGNSCGGTVGTVCTGGFCLYSKEGRGQEGFMTLPGERCSSGTPNGGICLVDGSVSQTCKDNSFSFDGTVGQCISRSVCQPGAPGCDCGAGGRCASGHDCKNDTLQCSLRICAPGSLGCQCLPGDTCDSKNPAVKCQSLTLDGTQNACLGTVTCQTNQIDRCKAFCGANNIKRCPPCDYQVPECFNLGSASSVTISFALILMSVVFAIMF